MSDDEDPYAVSSDSEDERPKGPPPKVAIEGAKDLKQLKESILAGGQMNNNTGDEFAVSSDPTELGADIVRGSAGGGIGDELAQLKSSLKEKKESWQNSVADAQAAGAADDEEKKRQLEEIKNQVSSVKQKWKTGDVEGASAAEVDAAKQEELEALKKSVNVKELFQPTSNGADVQKCYDRSELDTAAIADARKSFVEGSAYQSAKAESAAANELNELKFTEMNAFKDKFEKGIGDAEEIAKAKVELDLQLKELKKNFEKPESEMTAEERAELKKAEIEAEFARYKLARKMAGQGGENGEKKADGANGDEDATRRGGGGDEEGEYDVKNLMNKFKNIASETGTAKKKGEMNLEELEALRVEAKNLREQFERANQMEPATELSEEKKRQLEEEFKQLKEERERAKKELEEEQAEAAAAMEAAGKEDIQVAADHASKMAAKWEKIHKKEAKKAEKSKMPQK